MQIADACSRAELSAREPLRFTTHGIFGWFLDDPVVELGQIFRFSLPRADGKAAILAPAATNSTQRRFAWRAFICIYDDMARAEPCGCCACTANDLPGSIECESSSAIG